METNSSQKNLDNGLNGLSADKKVWIKPTVEMISQDKIASGVHQGLHEGTLRGRPGVTSSTIRYFVS